MAHYTLAPDIAISCSGDEEDSDTVRNRLQVTLAFAAGAACERHNLFPDVFLQSLFAVHDHKFILSCLWRNRDSAITFGVRMAEAWLALGGSDGEVEHYVWPGKFLFAGTCLGFSEHTVRDRDKPWPGDYIPKLVR